MDSEVEYQDPMAEAPYVTQERPVHAIAKDPETPGMGESEPKVAPAPRPLSPTRLQPVLAPQSQPVADLEQVLRIRSEIPRALKRRGSVDQTQPQKKSLVIQPNQYKQMINKLFRKRGLNVKGETGSDHSSSSDGEESPTIPTANASPITNLTGTLENKVTPTGIVGPCAFGTNYQSNVSLSYTPFARQLQGVIALAQQV